MKLFSTDPDHSGGVQSRFDEKYIQNPWTVWSGSDFEAHYLQHETSVGSHSDEILLVLNWSLPEKFIFSKFGLNFLQSHFLWFTEHIFEAKKTKIENYRKMNFSGKLWPFPVTLKKSGHPSCLQFFGSVLQSSGRQFTSFCDDKIEGHFVRFAQPTIVVSQVVVSL